jgi:hypothetical protein
MSTTITTAVTLVCIVVHQTGPIRNIPVDDIPLYTASGPNHDRMPFADYVLFPCDQTDAQALQTYLDDTKRREDESCPRCFPNDEPWGKR